MWGGSELAIIESSLTRRYYYHSRAAQQFLVEEFGISIERDFKRCADQILAFVCRILDLLCRGEGGLAGEFYIVTRGELAVVH